MLLAKSTKQEAFLPTGDAPTVFCGVRSDNVSCIRASESNEESSDSESSNI